MQPTTKSVTLPSGATTKIRKLCAKDYIGVGTLPDVYSEAGKGKQDARKVNEMGVRITEIILLNCIGAIHADNKPIRIVSKRFDECADNERSVEEFMATEDAAALVSEVLQFSGMTEATREAAKPFPEKQGGPGDGASGG